MHAKRPSVTFTHGATMKVHWPTRVSASQAGSLSTQTILFVGTFFFGSSGGTGETDHSRAQSVDLMPSGTQSLTLDTLPPTAQAANDAWGASATNDVSTALDTTRRNASFMGSSSTTQRAGSRHAHAKTWARDGTSRRQGCD